MGRKLLMIIHQLINHIALNSGKNIYGQLFPVIPFFKDYTTQYFLLILMKMLLWDLGFSLTQHCTRNEILFFRSEIAEDWKRYCHSISNLFYKLMPRYAGRRRTPWSSFLFFRFFFCNTLRIASLSDKLVFKLVGGCTVLWAVLCEWNISRHRHCQAVDPWLLGPINTSYI